MTEQDLLTLIQAGYADTVTAYLLTHPSVVAAGTSTTINAATPGSITVGSGSSSLIVIALLVLGVVLVLQ